MTQRSFFNAGSTKYFYSGIEKFGGFGGSLYLNLSDNIQIIPEINYLLDKNEKKLSKLEKFIILTEKEIQLLDLFLNNKKPVSKDRILSSVWNYSSDADTHTVETHIYRLTKKINEKFLDENFILNNKDGYYL